MADVKPAMPGNGTTLTSFVIVKHDGRWLIESAREVKCRMPPQTNRLKDLQWLVGEWSTATSPAGVALRSTCDWTANQAFLIRKFKVEGKGTLLHGGTEVIGWDPRSENFRSDLRQRRRFRREHLGPRRQELGDQVFGHAVRRQHGFVYARCYQGGRQYDDDAVEGPHGRRLPQPDIPETTLKKSPPPVPVPKVGAAAGPTKR